MENSLSLVARYRTARSTGRMSMVDEKTSREVDMVESLLLNRIQMHNIWLDLGAQFDGCGCACKAATSCLRDDLSSVR